MINYQDLIAWMLALLVGTVAHPAVIPPYPEPSPTPKVEHLQTYPGHYRP